MSNPAPMPEEEQGPWSDPDAYRAEFQRRLAEEGNLRELPEKGRALATARHVACFSR